MKSSRLLTGNERKRSRLVAPVDKPLIERPIVRGEADLFASPVTMAELERAYKEALREKGVSLEDWRQSLGA